MADIWNWKINQRLNVERSNFRVATIENSNGIELKIKIDKTQFIYIEKGKYENRQVVRNIEWMNKIW